MNKIAAIILLLICSLQLYGQKNMNQEPYPYGNPVITHMYTADAAPKVMPDGRLWMVTSVDHKDGGGYSTMHALHAFSTDDMVNWVDHGEILGINDFDVPEGEDWAIWAPDIIYRNGTYYLYFPMRNKLKDGKIDRYVAVAESDRMDKRFTITNPRMKGVERAGLDPSVFIDDDGVAYLYWNQALMGELTEDMREIKGEMFKLDYGANNFMEAAWMHKRNGKYYYNYHTRYNGKVAPSNPNDSERKKSHLDYSMGDSPKGPLKHMGVINYELGYNTIGGPKMPNQEYVPWRLTQSNHGAVVEYHGQEYFFYHTSALSSWRHDKFKERGVWTQRSVCVDSLNYRADGSVIPVQQTVKGVDKVIINQAFGVTLNRKDAITENADIKRRYFLAQNEDIIKFENVDLGSGYYYFEVEFEATEINSKIEVRKGSPNGLLMGTLLLNSRVLTANNGISQTFLREANGLNDIYLIIKSEGDTKVKFWKPRFFAGSPKKLKI
ncbi:family 43 glycosylhydrolase [Sediminitomix flava]|uniref:Carbohydrate binding protein with CBM6 domain n=1 Tax=Sediminitomix flava TaxID=379075 RepID=A0A315Z6J8_SEDFL|nr:family 43 glycosylhydrolase [Sediminitomix flava]PWJ37991.1 carbohydrate binding protein with CBM6 domain [Sediminitomix flava]